MGALKSNQAASFAGNILNSGWEVENERETRGARDIKVAVSLRSEFWNEAVGPPDRCTAAPMNELQQQNRDLKEPPVMNPAALVALRKQ